MTGRQLRVQLIIAVEGTKNTKTDELYINATIEHFDCFPHDWKISFVYMNGKSRFDDKAVQSKIQKLADSYGHHDKSRESMSFVAYAIDTDSGFESENLNRKIIQYCEERGYFLIYFAEDVENVFLGHSVSNGDKGREALMFYGKPIFNKNNLKNVSFSYTHGKSNILSIFESINKETYQNK